MVICRDKLHTELLFSNAIMNEVEVNFNMFGTSIENWICKEINGTNIIAPKDGGTLKREPKLLKE